MPLHPTAEAYRQARAAGDDTGAAAILVGAHSGTYNEKLMDDIHSVGRMSRAELNAPAPPPITSKVGIYNTVYVNGGGS